MPDVGSLYPQPQQQNALTSNPLSVIGALGQINQLRAFQSRQAVGQAAQNALGPNGTIDWDTYTQGLKNPAAAYDAQEGISNMIGQKAAMFNLGLGYNNAAQSIYGSLAAKAQAGQPVTDIDLAEASARLARAGMPADQVNAWRSSIPSDTTGRNNFLTTQYNSAIGPAGLSERVPGAPVGPQVTQQPKGVASYTTGAIPVTPTPAETAASGAIGTAAGGIASNLTVAADGSANRKGMLNNLEADLKNFTSGPNADWTNVAKAWANRNVLPTALQFDPTSISSQEQFNKQAVQLAQQQFQAIGGTGTDAKFNSAFMTNPNETLSKLGNTDIVHLLKGNEDALQAKNKAWQDWLASGKSPASYAEFSRTFNQTFDPRIYSSQYMDKQTFGKMISSMPAAEQQKFVANLRLAQKNGYAAGPGSFTNGP